MFTFQAEILAARGENCSFNSFSSSYSNGHSSDCSNGNSSNYSNGSYIPVWQTSSDPQSSLFCMCALEVAGQTDSSVDSTVSTDEETHETALTK